MRRNGVLLAVALTTCGCSGANTSMSPSSGQANLVIEQTPNPAHTGSSVTLVQHETAQVGVTAIREVIRFYDASGTLVRTDTYIDEDAWFSCDDPMRSVRRLPPGSSCSLTYTAVPMFPQYEYDLYVRDDNGNDLVFHTPRFVIVQ